MANLRDKFGKKSLVYVEFEPPSGWTEDPTCHYLLVDLPEFKMEEVKLQVNNQDQIIVSGERKVTENKYMRFEQKFHVPENSEIENISGKFEGGFLYVKVPKKNVDKASEESETIKTEDSLQRENLSTEKPMNEDEKLLSGSLSEKWNTGGNMVEILRKNKGLILTAVIAFSLGVLLSRNLHSNEHCEIVK